MQIGGKGWRAQARTWQALLAVWLVYALLRLALQGLQGWEPVGPDDWTRLIEVRALLGGQSWWDVTQYRINPPDGFSMHWSRLVDLPLALLIPVLGETAAMAAVPLLWLLPALFALRSIMLRLAFGDLAFVLGLILLPAFPLLPGVFAPMAIDHHGPQAVLATVCAALLLKESRWSAAACGLCAAAWLVISLEGLPLVAVIAGLYGLRYWWNDQRLLSAFLGALTLGAGVLSLATRAFEPGWCDVLLPGHVITFAAATLIAVLLPWLPLQRDRRARLAALGVLAALCLPLALNLLGACAVNPMQELDPLLQQYWHGYITEGLPLWKQPVSVMLMLVWTIGVMAAGWWTARQHGQFNQERALPAALLLLLALAAGGYSLLVMREGVVAQLLAIPFAAQLMAHWLPRARAVASALPRVLATLAALGLATPLFASAFAKPLDPVWPTANMRTLASVPVSNRECDYSALNGLPPGLIFAPLDAGPEILGRTHHSIVAANFHRNQRQMADVIEAFSGPTESALDIVHSYEADWVVVCASASDLALYRSVDPANFGNALLMDGGPDGLIKMGFDEYAPMVVFMAARPGGTPAPRR